jgi:TonB family protein
MLGAALLTACLVASAGGGPKCPSIDATDLAPEEHLPPGEVISRIQGPCNAKAWGQKGTVLVEVVVTEQGMPASVKVVSATPAGMFDKLAICNVRHMVFPRRLVRGKPTCYRTPYTLTFSVEPPRT